MQYSKTATDENSFEPVQGLGYFVLLFSFGKIYSVKAKFHYASWFEAGRRPALNQIAERNLALTVNCAL